MDATKLSYTAEQAIRWYREQPNNEEAVRANYFDLPVLGAAERFAAGEEFAEIRRVLGSGNGRAILDLGAGNGIASYALARDGWRVTALEPDDSAEVGSAAIRELAEQARLEMEIREHAELPLQFNDASFDAIFARQVLHHLPNLDAAFLEFRRVLKPEGCLLATREHVVSDQNELQQFLAAHPLHRLHGKENAFRMDEYVGAAERAGFRVAHVWGPTESILNFFPGTEAERQTLLRKLTGKRFRGFGRILTGFKSVLDSTARIHSRNDRTPGRIFAFLFQPDAHR